MLPIEPILIKLFSKRTDLFVNREFQKAKFITLLQQDNEEILAKLLSNPKIRKHFTHKIDNTLIFAKQKLLTYLNLENYTSDSYTRFKNKIGLQKNNDYITNDAKVVLTWPYKDSILAGNQTKENSKQTEKFYHEKLQSDQIDRLFDTKVLHNWEKYTCDKVTRDFKLTIDKAGNLKDNLIIRGNNLIALHSIKERFAGKVKLIYLDPPYNTGSDNFGYNDRFKHSTWLTFMKNRLEIARQFLSEAGAIFIQLDDSEIHYLKVMLDEIFGRNNFKAHIILKSSTASGVNAVNVKRGERLFKVKEHILFYAKNKKFRFYPLYTKAEQYNEKYRLEVSRQGSKYSIRDIKKYFQSKYGKAKARKKFIEYCLNNPENIYSLEKNIKKAGAKFKKFAEKNKQKQIVEAYTKENGEQILTYDGGFLVPLQERIVQEDGKNYYGKLISDLWLDISTTPAKEGGIRFTNGKKNEKLISRIIQLATKPQDIVMDFFLGSGTTAAVANKMNRQYIGIEQLNYGKNDCVVRLKNVLKGEKSGISKTVNWQGGGSFIYCELYQLNEKYMTEIANAITEKELRKIWHKIKKNAFITYELDLNRLDRIDKEFNNLNTAGKKQFLRDILDKNQLYLNLSEIEDETYRISAKNKDFNNQFYQKNKGD